MAAIASIAHDLAEAIASARDKIPVKVLVMGPNLKAPTREAALRRQIMQKAREYATVVSAECKELTSVAVKGMGEGHHLTVYEMFLVDLSNLVVLIPASPGSFCELGLFSSSWKASHKLLILANNAFALSGSYVADGPITSAKRYGAVVQHVDYNDFDSACGFVKTQVDIIRAQAQMESFLGPRSNQ